jgi:flagellar biosynthesis protein FliP
MCSRSAPPQGYSEGASTRYYCFFYVYGFFHHESLYGQHTQGAYLPWESAAAHSGARLTSCYARASLCFLKQGKKRPGTFLDISKCPGPKKRIHPYVHYPAFMILNCEQHFRSFSVLSTFYRVDMVVALGVMSMGMMICHG